MLEKLNLFSWARDTRLAWVLGTSLLTQPLSNLVSNVELRDLIDTDRAVQIEVLMLKYSVELFIEYSSTPLIPEVAIYSRMVQNTKNVILIQVCNTTTVWIRQNNGKNASKIFFQARICTVHTRDESSSTTHYYHHHGRIWWWWGGGIENYFKFSSTRELKNKSRAF